MDLGLLYGNFVMDDQEFILHSTPDGPSVFRDDRGVTHCAITSFQHVDLDIARDPLSINRRLFGSDGIEIFGTMVVAGPSQEVIYVLVGWYRIQRRVHRTSYNHPTYNMQRD